MRRGRASQAGRGGFSLLELLVVLALIGMLTAVVAPRLQRTYDAIAGSGERDEVGRQLERLPLLARHAGKAISIARGDEAALAGRITLPEGWSVSPLEELRIEASGVCHPARLRVSGRGVVEVQQLTAPACEVEDEE
jgi:prepilin-type N-terminal cleavage/methylation domain-containing protein